MNIEGKTAMNLYEQDKHFAHTTAACEPGTRTLGQVLKKILSGTLLVHGMCSMFPPGILQYRFVFHA